MVLLHLKAVFTLACLKRIVIFLTQGPLYMKVAHLLLLFVSVSMLEVFWGHYCSVQSVVWFSIH